MKLPHFGLHFVDLSAEESTAVVELAKLDEIATAKFFRVFRKRPGEATLYLDDGSVHDVSDISKHLDHGGPERRQVPAGSFRERCNWAGGQPDHL